MNTARHLQRGLRHPSAATINKIISALDLRGEWPGRLWRAAGIEPIDVHARGLALWQHLPGVLLDEVDHDEIELFEFVTDDLVIDLTRALGPLLAWLSLTARPPTRTQAARLRGAAHRVFDESIRARWTRSGLFHSGPDFAAFNAASVLPHAWRNELFASRESTARVAKLLRLWKYSPRGWCTPATITARMRKPSHDAPYSVSECSTDILAAVHDAMIVHRLWITLDLANVLGAPFKGAIHEYEARNQIGAPRGDLYTLLTTKPDELPLTGTSDSDRRRFEFRDAAKRVALALRLFELPDLAASVVRNPETGLPMVCEEVEALLRRAVQTLGVWGVRLSGTAAQFGYRDSGGSKATPPAG